MSRSGAPTCRRSPRRCCWPGWILLLLNPLLRRFGVLQRVWHEALFQGALYCAICAGLILWMGEMSR